MTKSNRYRSKRVIHITIRSSINDRSHKNLSSKIRRSIYTDNDRKPTTLISSKIAHSESEVIEQKNFNSYSLLFLEYFD